MNRISSKLSHLVRMACAAGVSASGIAYAQTVKAPPPVQAPAPVAAPATLLDDQWHGGISIGGAAASGNANSVVLSGAADAVKATTKDKTSLWGIANYGTSKTNGVKTTNADSLRLGGRYDYNLTDRVFAFGAAEAETNQVAGLRYRFSADVGAGYHVIRTPDTNFDVYGGVGVARNQYRSQWSSAYSLNGQPAVYQFQGDASASGAELLFGEESTHRLTSTTSFKQRLEIRPGSGDLGTLATFDAGLATAITGAWTLNTGVTVRHASKVPFGRKTTDSLLTVGFGYKY